MEVEYCKKTGREDVGDYFGFATDLSSNVNALLWAFGGKIMNHTADGEFKFVYYNDHTVGIFDKVINLIHNSTGIYSDTPHHSGAYLFNDMQALFAIGMPLDAEFNILEFEHDYGILPQPKYDENQAEYYTMADGSHAALAVAKNVTDYDFTGIMAEAMCAEAYKQIVPAYYDVCLKHRYASSPEDAEMIELCVDSRVFDFGYIYDNWMGVSFIMQSMVPTGQNTIASTFQKKHKRYTNYYNAVIKEFYKD